MLLTHHSAFVGRRLRSRTALRWLVAVGASCLSLACGDDSEDPAEVTQESVVLAYSQLVEASYADSLETASALHEAIHELTEEPSEDTLEAAKQAWLDARDPYGQTEAFRFYDGPIDDPDTGPEGQLNAWPIDESYVDYVVDANDAVVSGGIVNLTADFPTIDEATLVDANEAIDETTIATGYHAIEFLLWGQDRSASGPGERPFTDYVSGSSGTAENQDRRGAYLRIAADLLVSDLTFVHDAWKADTDNYRADFEALDPEVALGRMLKGMGSLSGAELSQERMNVAFENKDQEDEHSCFSDNTIADLRNNATSVQNVLLGNYAELDGPGIDDLVEAKDPALAEELRDLIQGAIDDIEAIPAPFDQAILGDDTDPGRVRVSAAIDSLKEFTTKLEEAAVVLGVPLELE